MTNLSNSCSASSHVNSSSTSLLTVLGKSSVQPVWFVLFLPEIPYPNLSLQVVWLQPCLWLKSSSMWLLSQSLLELRFIRRANKRNCVILVFSIALFEKNINHVGQRSTLPVSNKPTVLFHLQRRKMGFEYYRISMKLDSNEAQVHKRLFILLLGMKGEGEIVQDGIAMLSSQP